MVCPRVLLITIALCSSGPHTTSEATRRWGGQEWRGDVQAVLAPLTAASEAVAGVPAGVPFGPVFFNGTGTGPTVLHPHSMSITSEGEAPPQQQGNSGGGWRDTVMDIGGGTGASVSGTGDNFLDKALLRRMRHQDKAVLLLLLGAYFGSLLFSSALAYRQAKNDSLVTYYADPRFHDLTTDCEDVETFLEAFNQAPSDAQLQVVGLAPLPLVPEAVVEAVTWLGERYRVAFSFTLDLSPWLVPLGGASSAAGEGEHSEWLAGVARDDVARLRQYLATDTNDLSTVQLEKHVEWKDWEELATNIKSKIRQGGFNGVIDVRRKCSDVVTVHKNKQWANFMHSRTTKVLMALSVVGWFAHSVYMWLRHWSITIPCRYKVDVDIGQYWSLIQDKLGPDGFNPLGQVSVPPPPPPPSSPQGRFWRSGGFGGDQRPEWRQLMPRAGMR